MAAFDTCDCSESEFTTHDFCSVFRSCFDCVIWHIQLGRSRREDIIVLRKTFYEYVADSYMIFAPTLVFGSRNVFVIMLTLVLFSLVASYVVDWIYDRVSDMIFRK